MPSIAFLVSALQKEKFKMNNFLLSCIESRVENNGSLYGQFQLGPFDFGQGLTVATALRRALLSELTGLAITAVVIKGASHEYSTLSGVRESVLDILLNLKQVVLAPVDTESEFEFFRDSSKSPILTEPQMGFLKICGPGIVKAGDMRLPKSIQCVNPDQYIATLAANGNLEMKFLISQGKNYIVQTRSPSELASRFVKRATYNCLSSTGPSSLIGPANLARKNNDATPKGRKGGLTSYMSVCEGIQGINEHALKGLISNDNSRLSNSDKIDSDLQSQVIENTNETRENDSMILSNSILNSDRPLVSKGDETKNPLKQMSVLEQLSRRQKLSEQIPILNKNKSSVKSLGRLMKLRQDLIRQVNKTKKKKEDKDVHVLLIDAVFMPVNKVNLFLDNDEDTIKPKEKVILEIWTNGSIHPRKAIHQAALAAIELIAPFKESQLLNEIAPPHLDNKWGALRGGVGQGPETHLAVAGRATGATALNWSRSQQERELYSNQKKVKFAAKKDNLAIKKNRASIDIANLELSLRPYTCLKRANINTVSDLLQYSADELLLLKNFGKRSLEEVEAALTPLGFKLGKQNSK